MIFWLIIFLIIIAVSGYLSYLSMKNFPDIPDEKKDHGIFLIRAPQALNTQLLKQLKVNLKDQIVSLERLFKGDKKALVIFGPKALLNKFQNQLNLLELEDYTLISPGQVLSFEAKPKESNPPDLPTFNLLEDEQIWLQLTLTSSKGFNFHTQIRIAVISSNLERRKNLADEVFSNGAFNKLPLPQTSEQIYDNIKKRLVMPFRKAQINLTPEQIISMVGA